MKKIIALILALVVTVGTLTLISVAEDADPNVYLKGDFSSNTATEQDFHIGAYNCTSDILVGYANALALQSKRGWYSYDTSCEVNIGEDEALESAPESRSFSLVYNNIIENTKGLKDGSRFMSFVYDITNKQAYLCGDSLGFSSECIFAGPIALDIPTDGTESHTFGMSVTDGRIRCFVDGECIIDYIDEEDKYFIGDTPDVEWEDEPILLWWNVGNCLMFSDIRVTAPEYLFPIPVPVTYGDANGDGNVNVSDASLILKHVAMWEDLEIDLIAADVNGDEKVNLADVSMILKYIAGWEGIVLGPVENKE